jgi:hypothetical protein
MANVERNRLLVEASRSLGRKCLRGPSASQPTFSAALLSVIPRHRGMRTLPNLEIRSKLYGRLATEAINWMIASR